VLRITAKKYFIPAFVSLLLFLAALPLIVQINFFQNDDWVYYKMVAGFLQGNFSLHPYSAPTFYTQGFIATVFALVFGTKQLPVLTLAVTAVSFFVLAKILIDHLDQKPDKAVLLALLCFFNPLSVYLTLGFMTSQYFVLFLLLTLYFFLSYEKNHATGDLVLTHLFTFIGLMVRQVSLFIPLGLGIYSLYTRKFKLAVINFSAFAGYYWFYKYVFPLTPKMKELPLQFHNLTNFNYIFSLVYGVLIMLMAFFLPLALFSIDYKALLSNKLRLIIILLAIAGLYAVLNHYFDPEAVSWGEFPYFENTFERTGFYPRGLGGTKYQFMGIYDLYRYWDLSAKILLSTFLVTPFFRIIKPRGSGSSINVFAVLMFTYLGIMLVVETFFDRYIIVLLSLFLLYLVKKGFTFTKLSTFVTCVYVFLLAFIAYQFSMDFVLVNRYVWNKAQELSRVEHMDKSLIQGTNAWKLNYPNLTKNYLYDFSYDSVEKNEVYKLRYFLVETKTIGFPMSIFLNSKVYLYRLKN